MFKGALPHAAVLAGADGDDVWLWPLSRLVLEAAPAAGVGAEALLFWSELADWSAARDEPVRLAGDGRGGGDRPGPVGGVGGRRGDTLRPFGAGGTLPLHPKPGPSGPNPARQAQGASSGPRMGWA